jgi:hypothetical protein
MDAFPVASKFLMLWLGGTDCSLISGLLVQLANKLLALMVIRGAGAYLATSDFACTLVLGRIQLYPTRGPTASPSLR